MKILASLLFLHLFSGGLFAQTEKGATPLNPQSEFRTPHSTRAVVIGISDYQDPAIPDLQYAHRDAEAFAAWLQSPAGGKLEAAHLRLLTNEKATMGAVMIALDWLLESSGPEDQAIIYFSGHGDVEKRALTQPGFLLCWDAPARVYMAGGALALPMLQEVISVLSIQNKAKVVVITDAAHAGKLRGSEIGGTQITNANLARQYANETKILSCQPDEFSLEGEQWGGGRSVFSWRLLEGLYGLADSDVDGIVTLEELDRYLEFTVSADVMPAQQTPLLIGARNTILASIDPELSAVLQYRRREALPGEECEPCTRFYKNLENSMLTKDGAYNWLIRNPELTPFGDLPRVQMFLRK